MADPDRVAGFGRAKGRGAAFVLAGKICDTALRKRPKKLNTQPENLGGPGDSALTAFLMSKKADYSTRQIISVNGGLF